MGTNLKVAAVVVFTLTAYTLVANMIPQVESDVPEQLDLSGDVSTEQLVSAGERLYAGAGGCTACHGLGTRAPNLLSSEAGAGPIGARCSDRVAGRDCKSYLHESLVEPGAYLVEGYNPIMPDMSRTLSDEQIWALVAYLQAQGGEVTVTADDLAGTAPADAEPAAPEPAGGLETASMDPEELLQTFGCLGCHQLGDQGAALGPAFTDLGARSSPAEIRESILDPGAEIAEGYEQFAAMMPKNFGERMTAAQLDTLVSFLAAQR